MNAHGNWKLEWQGVVLTIRISGAFNQEGLIEFTDNVKSSIASHNISKWYLLEILDAETMVTPEAMTQLKALYEWYFENGCQSQALINNNILQKEIALELSKARVAVFDNETDALAHFKSLSC
ncbi:hypothetical protein OAP14_10695 [Aliiglaciecola sp.]|nr:hypothetical protein [Aliiglaciecola sp.]